MPVHFSLPLLRSCPSNVFIRVAFLGADVQDVHEEVVGQRPGRREDAMLRLAVVRA